MDFLADLWIPIVVSAVAVFIVSSLMWMVSPHHKADIQALPDEAAFDKAMGELNIPAGLYMYPNCHGQDTKGDAFKGRWKSGPWGMVNVWGSPPNFGKSLALTFLSYLLVSVFVAYIASNAFAANPSPTYLNVFQIVGPIAMVAYCFGGLGNDIFLGKPRRFIITSMLDGVAFSLVTAGVFGWQMHG